jgi:type IV fimbrial biogenesis protein FimT
MTTTHTADPRSAQRGLNLLELIGALAVLGALLVLAPGSYADWISRQELANHAHHFAETLELARSEAIKHGLRVNVCKSTDGRQCDSGSAWHAGWIMFGDDNRNGEIDEDEPVFQREGNAPRGVTITQNHPVDDYVSYTSLGHARLLSGALQMGTFVVCKSGQNALKVVLANGSRARIEKTHDRCA